MAIAAFRFTASLRHKAFCWTFMALLFVERLHSVYSVRYGCPARALIKPCACHEKTKGLDISCEGANVDQLKEAFENIAQTGQSLSFLRLRNNNLRTLQTFLLDGLDIRHIIIHHSNLSFIDETAFFGLGERLESLDLSQNSLNQVPSKPLEMLSSLVSLNLNYNNIETIHAESFKGLISLLRLSLYGNKIRSIDANAFLGIGGNITRINLGGNLLPSVPSQSLVNLTTLKRLQLHENKITVIQKHEFKGILAAKSLDVLNLATNLLHELPEKAFHNLGALNSLDLEGNSISSIHQNAFEGIEDSLEWITLGDNRLFSVPSFALRNVTKLRQLDLRRNNITRITEKCLKEFGRNLKFLYLQENKIQYIEPGAFDNLISLEWLHLHSNQLTALSNDLFYPILDSIKLLDVHDNPLVCDCNVVWFRDWVSSEGANVVTQPKETKCSSPNELVNRAIVDVPSELWNCNRSAFLNLDLCQCFIFHCLITFLMDFILKNG